MSYLTILASVPEQQIKAIQANSEQLLHPTAWIAVSHMMDEVAYRLDTELLGRLLSEVVDGGKTLSRDYNHPLRPPVYHDPAHVRTLSKQLDQGWEDVKASGKINESATEYRELIRVLKLYRNASVRKECVVSVLLPPTDLEGFDWVKIPFVIDPKRRVESTTMDGRRGEDRKASRSFLTTPVAGSISGIFALCAMVCFWRYRRCRGKR